MNREDKYSLQALDFTKSKTKEKAKEDMFPIALDLSMHPSEPSCSTYVDGNQLPVHNGIQNYLGRGQRFWENGMTVAEDLRVVPCTNAERLECGQNPMRWLKGNRTGAHSRRQDELKVNQLIGKKMKGYNELLATKLFNDTANVDEGLSFNFQKTIRSEDFDASFGQSSSASQIKDLPFAKQVDCNSKELLEKCISTSDANTQKRQTVLRYGSEASLSEIARSSFGQSCDLQDGQQYDEYAKQFADFLKSTASSKRNEPELLSSSEESQADEIYEVNILEEESNQPDAFSSLLVENETSVCPGENESLQKCETRLDIEESNQENLVEFTEESLMESKSEIAVVSEPNDAETSVAADAGGKKRKRKTKDVEHSDLQASKPKRKKTSQPQTSEAKTNVMCLAAANVFEYQWPQEKNADWFVLQEHITEFLGILSFKRKYPDIFRRSVDISERNFLRERGVVTEMQCDLGLTALKTEDVCDLMSKDYPEKYQEYTKLLSSRQKIAEPPKVHENTVTEKSKIETLLKKSIKATADYNASLMRERYHERRAYFDLQTFEVHYPNNTRKSKPRVPLKIGAYPVSLLPGQYQDYYKRYTQQELNYFPLNTALYSPHKMLKSIFTDPTCVAVDDTEDDDGPDEGHDHISISSSLDQTIDDVESVTPEKDKKEDKRIGPENIDPDKQKLPIVLSLDAEDSITMLEDSAENSRSSFKDIKVVGKTPSSSRRMPRSSGKKKLDDVLSIDIDNALNDAFSGPGRELLPKCVVCSQAEKSYDGLVEDIVQCSECSSAGHPSCLDLTKEMVEVIRTYPWQCMECKTCIKCMEPHDEEKMMFCDHCDRGYHTFCVGLKSIPEGRWECPTCQDIVIPPKPKRGRPLKYPRPQATSNHVTPKADAT